MPALTRENVERYLATVFHQPVIVLNLAPLGENADERSLKQYGYGTPVQVRCSVDGEERVVVIRTVHPAPFGHEHMADRAQVLLWEHAAFNRLPRHVRSYDVGGFTATGELLTLGCVDEFFLLTEYAEGSPYVADLARIQKEGTLSATDLARADALCDYLVEIHGVRGSDPELYLRRIRELIGHGECIMGLADSYPRDLDFPSWELLEEVEHLCVRWRWRLKSYSHRLRRVHGDFHPWNILFRTGCDFTVLDRSRGEFGDPADDVSSLTLNYVFCSLQQSERVEGPFATLFQRFWRRYLDKTGDEEMLHVVAPFFVFRALVMGSPVWYPSLSPRLRRTLFHFMHSVLQQPTFDPARITEYCGA